MTIFNKLHKFFIVLFLGTTFSVTAEYYAYAREINLNSDYEVTKVAQELFFNETKVTDRKTGIRRDMTVEEYKQEFIRAKTEVRQNATGSKAIFVCIIQDNIVGAVCCQYGHRKSGMVEIIKSKVFGDTLFYPARDFNSIMETMTQYIELFYRSRGMQSIIVHVLSKHDASFYTQYGYRLLSSEEANNIYYTTTDNAMFVLGLPFIIALFPIYALYKACDWGIFYKEL